MSYGIAGAIIDVVPERFPYRDDGCEVSPSRLRCPLPQCKYDNPGWIQRHRRMERDREVATAVLEEGISVSEAASSFALSQRTIFRILKRSANEEQQPEWGNMFDAKERAFA